MITRESLKILEFDRILRNVARFCHSSASEKCILDIGPFRERAPIEKRFRQVEEIRQLGQTGTSLRLSHFEDISEIVGLVRPENSILDPRQILNLVPVMRMTSEISHQLRGVTHCAELLELASDLTGFPEILSAIEKALDPDGTILDTASSTLFDLRTRRRALEGSIRKRLEEMLREQRISIFLQDSYITERSGRWVLPVRMDSKGQVPGVVHDVSRSGETAFTEPLEILGVTNELENIVAEEKAEEIRILKRICRKIRESADEIEKQYRIIIYLDLLNSIAGFADFLDMKVPLISEGMTISLRDARHPLLLLASKEGRAGDVVPLDLDLGTANTVMVISGPNAGGKTVAIKTCGLLLLMALSGIPVPADSASGFPLLSRLLIDLGDEQSIEENLSTFSAHISNISEIMKKADSQTVVLFDELGTGTDPLQGAALSCAVIEELRSRGALVLATTHLTEIVGYAYRTGGMVNASMEFDHDALVPLYRLKTGEPGQSHALEIAARYGLSAAVIERAKGILGGANLELTGLISELQEKRATYERALQELDRREADLKEKEASIEKRLEGVEEHKEAILERAYDEAQSVLSRIRAEASAFLEEVKREKSREKMKRIIRIHDEVKGKLEELRKEPSLTMEQISEGDLVFVKSVGYDAVITRIDRKHKRIKVISGSRELEVPVSDLGPGRGKAVAAPKTVERRLEPEEVPSRINLIGLRTDEAISQLDPFIDRAFRAGHKEVTIIHGMGTGALSKAVKKYVSTHALVSEYRSGEPREGGNGVTVVKLSND